MPRRSENPEDPTTTFEVDEYGHLPEDADPLVAAEWYATHDQPSMAVLALIRHTNGGRTPGESARVAASDETTTED